MILKKQTDWEINVGLVKLKVAYLRKLWKEKKNNVLHLDGWTVKNEHDNCHKSSEQTSAPADDRNNWMSFGLLHWIFLYLHSALNLINSINLYWIINFLVMYKVWFH